MKKRIHLFLVLLILASFALFVVGCSGESSSSSNSSTSTQDNTAQQEEKIYKVGEEVQVGNLVYKVEKVEKTQQVGNDLLNKKANGTFLVVTITVTNKDKESRMIDTTMFKLVQGNTKYDADSEATSLYANENNRFFLQNINPNISATGKIVFDIPANATGLKLLVQDKFFGTQEKTIDLGV
ncbi:MAG: hypothetical protein PWQ91_1856 [Eubacteriales bacterium]|nr:hypothetical protein [Eubacteriales bacterium]MDN5364791.1 hypothetical protein [Eubacteriales bacterium]